MHLQRKVWRHLLCAAALVTFALPLATPLATPAHAQQAQPSEIVSGCTPSTTTVTVKGVVIPGTTGNCYVAARMSNGLPVAFNPIGQQDTATFICDALTASLFGLGGTVGAQTVPAGCYNVQATVTDITTGSPATIVSGTCGNVVAGVSGGAVDCSGVRSPICPVGSAPTTSTTAPCLFNSLVTPPIATNGYSPANTATATINPGANHAYRITFTGYIPTSSLGSCPAGTTLVPNVVLTISAGVPPISVVRPTAPGGACSFSISVDKKYVEITRITLTTTPAICGGQLFFAEGLKSFFGPTCSVVALAYGTVVLKTGVDCTTEPATGTAAPSPFPSGSTYACSNGTLSVTNILMNGIGVTFSVTGPASFNQLNTLGGSCAGLGTTTSLNGVTGIASVALCATGPGAVSIQACLTLPLPNNQPEICSSTISFTFTQVARRVVPQVRWAGEKIELTKCFGPALQGEPVEFVLKGNNPGLNATLLPTGLGNLFTTGAFENTATVIPENDTIWTVTDVNGCASVLGFADGEGQMLVDAAIFSSTEAGEAAGTPIVNEHVFEVFYLKFDHLDLENINPAQVYQTATALKPYLGWLAGTADVLDATVFPTSFTLPSPPGANMEVAGPTGYSVPLCATQYIRAMVHGYFEIPGDPSGRPATSVAVSGAPLTSGGSPSAGSFVLPAGRWVLPEDWPVLATFAGFGAGSNPPDFTPSSVLAWDLNGGWVFNPAGENPIFCVGNGTFAPDAEANGLGEGASLSIDGGYGAIPLSKVDLGPCSSVDGAGTFYETSPAACKGGETIGIGPFDPNQACTTSFPLTYAPAGSTAIGGTGEPGAFSCPTGVVGLCQVPTGPNSTYLPNATLNQWDAPMPPAQISFGIVGSPAFGFLDEVNKTGLYGLTFDLGATFTCSSGTFSSSLATCVGSGGVTVTPTCSNTGYTFDPLTETCRLEVNPDPFYSEAIPASPFIPPVTNNGGYLWNSWNFTAGTVTAVRATPTCFSNAPAGSCVPGQSTSVFATFTQLGITALPLTCPSSYFTTPATGGCNVPGGINVTTCVTSGTSDSIVVGDGSGFLPGMTVEVYSASTGVTIAGSLTFTLAITNVLASPQPGFPLAAELVFAPGTLTPAGVCGAAFTEVFIARQFGLPVPSAAPFHVGDVINIGSFGAKFAEVPVFLIDATNNIVYVTNTGFIAFRFGPCNGSGSGISRPGGPIGNLTCEPNLLVPPGTLVQTGPVAAGGLPAEQTGPPPTPYPFWQWVPAPPAAGSAPTAGTVYSDNHGESVVSLSTAIATQVLPVHGACPGTPYVPLTLNGVVISCELPNTALGALGLGTVAAALKAFSASSPGCIQTFPSGTFVTLANATIGPNGPAAGQICVNSLGGIEFGASATLGQTTVQAVADYPYTRGEHPPIGSAPLTKIFTSAFVKSVAVSAGTPGPAGTTSYVVTITAKDVCGFPIFGEPIQVYALGNAGAAVLAPISAGVVLSASTTSAVLTVDPITGQATLSLEVLNTAIGTQGLIIKAVFPFERVERFAVVIAGTVTGLTVTVPYAPGWQQIGGPPGSNFSVVEALFAYDPVSGTYTNASAAAANLSSAPPSCTGYWAYFAAPMVVSLPVTSKSGDTATCTLAAGWNLVGNPFATPASIQSGVTAYHWNGTSYDVVGTIPVGGSVWIFNDGTHNSVVLTAT